MHIQQLCREQTCFCKEFNVAEEKTEQPTAKRLRDAREKGDIPKSSESVSAVSVLCIVMYFIFSADKVMQDLSALFDSTINIVMSEQYEEALPAVGAAVLTFAFSIIIPCIAAAFLGALLSLLAQTGFLFAPKAAIPKLENLNPSKWFKKVFSKKNAFDFLMNLIKITILCAVVYKISRDAAHELFTVPFTDLGSLWRLTGELLSRFLFMSCGAFCAVAAVDFVYTRFKYTKDHMMSRDEVKKEYKQSEGDPLIKSKRRQLHQEMISSGNRSAVSMSKAVIVNPTHYAVGIFYEKGKTDLPLISAKGKDSEALQIIKYAEEYKVPVIREPPLARKLYADGSVGKQVPADLLIPVAKILGTLMQNSKQTI